MVNADVNMHRNTNMQSYEKVSKESLELLMEIVEEFYKIDPSFDLTKFRVFLSVALQNGIEAQTIASEYQIPKTTMSNIVLTLTPQGYLRTADKKLIQGLGLIVQEPSPRDARAKALHLTFDGKQLVDRLTQIILKKRKVEDGT